MTSKWNVLGAGQVAQYELTEESKQQAYNVVVNGTSVDNRDNKYFNPESGKCTDSLWTFISSQKASSLLTSILASAVPLRN